MVKIMEKKITDKPLLSITELSNLTGIKHDTIRFWAEKGLVTRVKNPENGYYGYGFDAITDIQMIEDLQKLGIQLKNMKTFTCMPMEKQTSVYLDNLKQIEKQIEKLNNFAKRINFKLKFFSIYKANGCKMTFSNPPFERLSLFNLLDKKVLSLAIDNPLDFTSLMYSHDPDKKVYCCVDTTSDSDIKAFWIKNPQHRYIKYYAWCDFEKKYNSASFNLTLLNKLGYKTVLTIGVFKCNTKIYGKNVALYEIWTEIE